MLASAIALASGWPPFTVDDALTVPRGGQATVLSTGQASVLANDIDLERDPLTASVTRPPRRGTLDFRPDGTFVYVHDGSSTDSDEFRYVAFDGTRFSREAHVRITVTEGSSPPRITGQRNLSTAEDMPLAITLQDLIVEDQDRRYPEGFSLVIRDGDNYSIQGTTILPDPNFGGLLSVPALVNDGQTDSNEFLLSVNVVAVNDAPTVTGAIGEQQAAEGEPFVLDVAGLFADVDALDALTFTASGLPPSGSLRMSADGVLSGTPVSVDTLALGYRVVVTARDRGSASASTEFILRILPRRVDLATGITAQPEPTTVGTAPQWSLEVRNVSTRASDPVSLAADWYSTGGPVTLTPTSSCVVLNSRTQVACDIPGLPPGGVAVVRVQSSQASPGDQAVIAHLEIDDANIDNNAAFKSLNLAGSFNESPAQRLAGATADLAVGDLDNDGYTDLVAVTGAVRIFFNTGARALDSSAVTPAGSNGGDTLVLVDWNSDTLPDIAALRRDGQSGRVFLNEGARRFASGQPLAAFSVHAAAGSDYDGDGTLELAVTGASGTAFFEAGANPSLLDGRAGRDLATADFNADGRDDLAVALDDGTVAVFVNTGAGSFTRATLAGFTSVAQVAAGDVNGDGAPDLLLAVDAANLDVPQNFVLRNDGNASFAPFANFGATETAQLLVDDVDGDGFADVIAINASGVHQVYLGNGSGALTLQSEFLLSPSTRRAALKDLDADDVPDLMLGGIDAPSIEVLRNNGIGRFGPGDNVAPVITLLGEASVTISAATTYVDAGATASDDVSGDVTPRIVVDNPVNAAVVGTYTVRYDVTDRAGNAAATVVRTVVVEAATGGGGGGGQIGVAMLLALAVAGLLRASLRRVPVRRNRTHRGSIPSD